MLFGGFKKCLYPIQNFDSDTERRFSIILERDAIKWFKPAKGQFKMYYKKGTEHPEYVPDFIVETSDYILMVETKSAQHKNEKDRKSTRLNSSHVAISYAVFCLKKKKSTTRRR